MNEVLALVIVSRLEQEQRIKETENWNRAVGAGNASRRQQRNRLFGRKREA